MQKYEVVAVTIGMHDTPQTDEFTHKQVFPVLINVAVHASSSTQCHQCRLFPSPKNHVEDI